MSREYSWQNELRKNNHSEIFFVCWCCFQIRFRIFRLLTLTFHFVVLDVFFIFGFTFLYFPGRLAWGVGDSAPHKFFLLRGRRVSEMGWLAAASHPISDTRRPLKRKNLCGALSPTPQAKRPGKYKNVNPKIKKTSRTTKWKVKVKSRKMRNRIWKQHQQTKNISLWLFFLNSFCHEYSLDIKHV